MGKITRLWLLKGVWNYCGSKLFWLRFYTYSRMAWLQVLPGPYGVSDQPD